MAKVESDVTSALSAMVYQPDSSVSLSPGPDTALALGSETVAGGGGDGAGAGGSAEGVPGVYPRLEVPEGEDVAEYHKKVLQQIPLALEAVKKEVRGTVVYKETS